MSETEAKQIVALQVELKLFRSDFVSHLEEDKEFRKEILTALGELKDQKVKLHTIVGTLMVVGSSLVGMWHMIENYVSFKIK